MGDCFLAEFFAAQVEVPLGAIRCGSFQKYAIVLDDEAITGLYGAEFSLAGGNGGKFVGGAALAVGRIVNLSRCKDCLNAAYQVSERCVPVDGDFVGGVAARIIII